MTASQLSVGQLASLACLLEASASKPGNVHRGADFEDVTFVDFAASALAVGPVFDQATTLGVGRTVLAAIEATQRLATTNTNLGLVLLLAPLACVPSNTELRAGVGRVLEQLTAADCHAVYAAIRLAKPSGLGQVAEADIAAEPPSDLVAAMQLAAARDLVARQYANGFAEVFDLIAPALVAGVARGWSLHDSIVQTFVGLLRDHPDTLIARKCGSAVAEQAAQYAAAVLRSGEPGDDAYVDALADLDFWLRADGHRRNPGTSADLIAAGLFVGLRAGAIVWPQPFYRPREVP